METLTQKWFAVYTKPRWEKKVYRLLTDRGIEAYCPLSKTRKKWSDRIKIVEEPLFKSYVFVHVTEDKQSKVRMVNGVLNFVYWNGKPAVLKQKEIDTIRKFLNEYEEVQALPLTIVPNQEVRIERGLLMNHVGKVQKILNNQVEILIESLGYRLVALLDKKNLAPSRHS